MVRTVPADTQNALIPLAVDGDDDIRQNLSVHSMPDLGNVQPLFLLLLPLLFRMNQTDPRFHLPYRRNIPDPSYLSMMRQVELAAFEQEEREAGVLEKPSQRKLHSPARGRLFEAPQAKIGRLSGSHNVTLAQRHDPDTESSSFAPVALGRERYVRPVVSGHGRPVAERSRSEHDASCNSPFQPAHSADSAEDSRMHLRLQAWMMEETKLRTEFQREMESARKKQQQQLDSIETLVTAMLLKFEGTNKKIDAICAFLEVVPSIGSTLDSDATTIAVALHRSAQETAQEGRKNASTSSVQPPAMQQDESFLCSQNVTQPTSHNAENHFPFQAGHPIENLPPSPQNGETFTRESVDGMKQEFERRPIESMEEVVLADLLFAQQTSPTDVAF